VPGRTLGSGSRGRLAERAGEREEESA